MSSNADLVANVSLHAPLLAADGDGRHDACSAATAANRRVVVGSGRVARVAACPALGGRRHCTPRRHHPSSSPDRPRRPLLGRQILEEAPLHDETQPILDEACRARPAQCPASGGAATSPGDATSRRPGRRGDRCRAPRPRSLGSGSIRRSARPLGEPGLRGQGAPSPVVVEPATVDSAWHGRVVVGVDGLEMSVRCWRCG